MTVNHRSMVTMVLMLVTSVIVLVHPKDVTTFEYDDLLPTSETNVRHRIDTETTIGDHRQGRMSLQAELPSSKAKREQTLRNILAARRRQILNQRPIEFRTLNRTLKPIEVPTKDSLDVLEAQETRHGMYVTAAASKDEETSRVLTPSKENEFLLKDLESKESTEYSLKKPSNESSTLSINESSNTEDTSSTTSPIAGTQKASDPEVRKKNIVSMPESLYNYFRPVESNIPVEDMSQFLYFGQKIQPDSQNNTGNNSVESTPTVPTAPSSRRRYSMKRFSTTTPLPKLEEIMNEEMNIAVERQTVEKNKVSRIKNAFRSAENGVYYRKTRPTEATIASNVIVKDSGGNRTEARTDDNPSAHADQLRRERGSTAHVPAETRNATQIPYQQPVSANTYDQTESENGFKDAASESKSMLTTLNGVDRARATKSSKKRKTSDSSTDTASGLDDTDAFDMEMFGEQTEKKIRRIDMMYDLNDKKADNVQPEQPDRGSHIQSERGSSRESNNIETSTFRDKISRSSTEPIRIVWTSPETSTLRIIVTEGSLEESFAIGTDAAVKYTVKPVDSTEERVRGVASGDVPTPRSSGEPIETAKSREQQQQQPEVNQERQQDQQQQHVYAYTITNVTRLLRNYTGPGLSREGGIGTTEITNGSAQRRQPPSSLQLPRADSIEAARAPAELSTGTTVEAAGGAEQLVGERQRKVVTVAGQQSQQRAVAANVTQLTSVNKTGPRSTKEANHRGTVRWNHTKTRNTDLEGFSDRRLLKKSASAVLNQRIGANIEEDSQASGKRRIGGNLEEDTQTIGKRRRLTNGQSVPAGRRVKGMNKSAEENGSHVNGSSLIGDNKNSTNEKNVENMAKLNRTEEVTSMNMTEENVTMQQSPSVTNLSIPTVEETIESTTPGVFVNMTEENNSTKVFVNMPEENNSTKSIVNTTEENYSTKVTLPSETVNDTKDENLGLRSESADNAASSASGADNATTESGSGSPTVTVTATTDETIVPKETTPIPAPVFPVTPKIITEANRPQKETFTKPTESAKRMTETETSNLDPSEIQKMYRSTTASGPVISSGTEVPTTTPVTSVQIEISTIPQEQSVSTSDSNETRSETTTTTAQSRKRISGERSPEVRGRNLSDKSQDASPDKDDILPIMHLYNTSDIFNGSGPMNSISRGTERRIELPVSSKRPGISRTTNETVTPKNIANDHSNRTSETRRHEENRETTTQIAPTGPGRGSTNRTRHRPVYHPVTLPEYNNTVFPSEMNRTFFEAELISVSPRESVNISEVISKRHDGDAIASQETVAVVSYILATLVVFPIAVGVGLILRRLILRNRKVLEESDTSSEISCRKDALNLENGDFKTSIEKAITKLPRIQHLCHEAEKPPPPLSQESRWEFPRDKLRLQTVLGQGNFGQVWKAEADDLTGHQGTTRLVAVKTVKEGASEREKEDLVRELEIMQQLGSHPNVVTLLGCCTEEEPHYLILEYVMYGKLLAYLRDHRTRQDFYNFSEDSAALTSRDLTVFGYCVARGMEYLASKKIIHRDLAARNVLVDHNKLCKIADFGMSRFANEDGEVIETRHGRNALPIRWMAPESLIYSLFTTKTDVWSFGILMWEIVTLGSTPYPDMTAREVMRNVQNGYRLERPSHCRSELFRVISRCWHADPDRRPEFQALRRDLAQLLEDNMNGHYVDLESFASECTD